MKASVFGKSDINKAWTLITWALILEFPVRYVLFPDPWLQSPEHRYFTQPLRLLTETVFLLLALWPVFWSSRFRDLLVSSLRREQLLYLFFGALGSLFLFAFLEFDELKALHRRELWMASAIWFLTGFLTGVGQEITFRGLLLTGLQQFSATKTALALSTLAFVFGSIHSQRLWTYAVGGNISDCLLLIGLYAAFGWGFGLLRLKSKSTLVPAIIHGLGNAVTWGAVFTLKVN